jgi:N-acetylglucosaminyldiphosphoundecaprenol N-acetyl-beta-D-mannosaminyltransferase
LNVVGTFTPPFRPLNDVEEQTLIANVAATKPDLFWVGLSTPKQERFMSAYLPKLDTSLMIGVGAAFDFYAGKVKQAPRWIQRSGFEWAYRLYQEPRRLWKRYARNNPLFVGRVLLQKSGLRKYSID